MGKLIGICGGSCTTRRQWAWLLAHAIEDRTKGFDMDTFKEHHTCRVSQLQGGDVELYSTNHVILDSFAEFILDQVKLFNPNLQPYDLTDAYIKHNKYVLISTGEVMEATELNEVPHTICSLEQLCKVKCLEAIPGATLTVNNYILYFADHVIKRYFGKDVWLNATIALNKLMGGIDYRIYWDVKTQGEHDYIKNSGGFIICLPDEDPFIDRYQKIDKLQPDFDLSLVENILEQPDVFYMTAGQILNH